MLAGAVSAGAWPSRAPIPALFPERGPFLSAIARARSAPGSAAVTAPLTALVVPHHLLAADLIARGFALAAAQRPRRIILIGPDHFRYGRTPFAVCLRDLETCLGPVPVDLTAAARLLAAPGASSSSLFSHDHAFQAVAPFLAHHFPGVPVLAVAVRGTAREADWAALARALSPLSHGALMVQSTDFSHYVPWDEARRCDQRTLEVLASGEPAAVAGLSQPLHTDCRGALYVTLALAREKAARALVVENRNSSEYAGQPVASSTSYIVALFSPEDVRVPHAARLAFAGDVFTGRHLTGKLDALVARAARLTGGAPLVVNLEGVLSDRAVPATGRPLLAMPVARTLAALKALNVKAASLANNHALDLGPAAREATRALLERAGIPAVLPGQTRDLGPVHLSALTDCDNSPTPRVHLLSVADLDRLPAPPPGKPWVAFLHWGAEWSRTPTPRERDLARRLHARGVNLVIGAHPHTAGGLESGPGGALAYSLGNFLFDQRDPRAAGALLELRFFRQGTHALRLLPIGNLYR